MNKKYICSLLILPPTLCFSASSLTTDTSVPIFAWPIEAHLFHLVLSLLMSLCFPPSSAMWWKWLALYNICLNFHSEQLFLGRGRSSRAFISQIHLQVGGAKRAVLEQVHVSQSDSAQLPARPCKLPHSAHRAPSSPGQIHKWWSLGGPWRSRLEDPPGFLSKCNLLTC